MFLLWASLARAACPSTSADLGASLEVAEAAYADMDTAGFLAATNRVTAEANCLAESVPRSTIARLHRVEGLRAFVDKDAERAAEAFASARAIEPGYTFPEAIVPAGHPVRASYASQDPASGTSSALAAPAVGYLSVDGRNASQRPDGRPVLAQLVGADGGVVQSRYLWPGDPLFAYDAAASTVATSGGTTPAGTTSAISSTGTVSSTGTAASSPSLPLGTEPDPGLKKGPNLPLTVATGAALVLSGVCYGVAKGSYDHYYADDVAPADLEGLRGRTNTMFLVSVGSGVATLGLAVGAVVTGRW